MINDRNISNRCMFWVRYDNLIFSNEELDGIMKIESLEDAGLLIKCVSKAVENEEKGQNGGSLCMLPTTLDVSLLSSILTGK